MKVNHKFEFAERDRQLIRAALGRRGLSSRTETRIFIERAVREALDRAPEPKVRRPKVAVEATVRQGLAVLQALPDEAVCGKCKRMKSDHGRMGLTCLPTTGRLKGERFTQVVGGIV